MKKELETINMNLLKNKKKVDLRIANKKYSLTFPQHGTSGKVAGEPVVLGVNNQNELRIMVNTSNEEDVENIVQEIKDLFQEYLNNAKNSNWERKTFHDITFHNKKHYTEQLVQVDIMHDRIQIKDEGILEILYKDINDIFVERKLDMSRSGKSKKDDIMKYALIYEKEFMVEVNGEIITFTGADVEKMFSALSQAFFLAQMKNREE